MYNKKLFSILFLIFFLNINIFILAEEENINYGEDGEIKKISDFRSSIFNTLKDGYYYIGSLLPDNSNIIGFADINSDKMNDIITYNMTEKEGKKDFSFYVHYYKKENPEDDDNGKFESGEKLFNIEIETDQKVRNLIVGSFFKYDDKKPCFLVTFEKNEKNGTNDLGELNHYLVCKDNQPAKQLDIHSNILLFNSNSKIYPQILYYDYNESLRKVCEISYTDLCKNSYNFSSLLDKSEGCLHGDSDSFVNKDISLKGGMAFTDINGDCNSDIILTHEEDKTRYYEIYKSRRDDQNIKFCLQQENIIKINDPEKYGAFTLSKINDEGFRNQEISPMLDLIIPKPGDNSILILFNQVKVGYEWSKNYCEKHENHKDDKDPRIYIYEVNDEKYTKEEKLDFNEFNEEKPNFVTDATYPTVIRLGDFLSVSNPGILVKQIVTKDTEKKHYICLYKRDKDGDKYKYQLEVKFDITKIDKGESTPLFGLFFDIDETGSLSVIIPCSNGKNYFFFNSKKNVFFLKSKLMKSKDNYYDTDLGTTYRYIVTNKSGQRHMDISYQLIQTSDMNIPLPYSLIGLDEINNYVEYFHSIVSNFVNNEYKSVIEDTKNWRQDSPIIPNTQMMIYRFINTNNKIEWSVDLIVQPMEKLFLFLFLVIAVLLIVLGITTYLHVKEVKEEQKEATKFKSWFA